MNLICGINPVLEALQAGSRHFDRLLIVKGIRNRRVSEAISRASQLSVPLRFESRETLDRLTNGLNHQGIIAVVSSLPVLSLEQLLEGARERALLVALDGVEDPRNLGAILRTAETAGADGVLLPERRSAGLSETVSRASAGALEHVRIARIGNVAQSLEMLKARGIWVIGFDAEGGERWDEIDYDRPVALVFGGEGRGMRRLVRERCDQLASLPRFGHVASLNVSVAAGIALYEVIRQRGVAPSQVRPIPIAPPPSREVVGPAPDDAEHDPGSGLAGPIRPGDEPLGEDDEQRPRVLIHDDEVAWTAVTPDEVIGPRRRRGRAPSAGPRRRGSPSAPAPAAEPAPAEAQGRRETSGREGVDGSRRRRRRRPKRAKQATGLASGSEKQASSVGGAAIPNRRRRRRRRASRR